MIAEVEEPAVETRLPGSIADALADLVGEVKDSVVQVRCGNHGSGSGAIWRSDGIIMTNHHVVAQREHAKVLLGDNCELRATVIARDPVLDLAALKVDAAGLRAAAVGPSQSVRVGELVIAIGNPRGQRGVVTAGIISGIGAIETGWRRGKAKYIRSDVQLAPGNSGGPMLDARGCVIGINAMIFGGDLGVAIPSHIATQFLAVAEGQQPVLGVGVQQVVLPTPLQGATQQRLGLLVVAIQHDSAAQHGGVLLGDVLLDIAERPVDDQHTLKYALAQQPLGSQVPVRLLRGGAIQTVTVSLDAPQSLRAVS